MRSHPTQGGEMGVAGPVAVCGVMGGFERGGFAYSRGRSLFPRCPWLARDQGELMHRIGVCSWSLRPTDAADLAARVGGCGVRAVQLALDPIRDGRWAEVDTAARL